MVLRVRFVKMSVQSLSSGVPRSLKNIQEKRDNFVYQMGAVAGSVVAAAVGGGGVAGGLGTAAFYYLGGVAVSTSVQKLAEDIRCLPKNCNSETVNKERTQKIWEALCEFVPIYAGSTFLGVAQFYSIAACMGCNVTFLGLNVGFVSAALAGITLVCVVRACSGTTQEDANLNLLWDQRQLQGHVDTEPDKIVQQQEDKACSDADASSDASSSRRDSGYAGDSDGKRIVQVEGGPWGLIPLPLPDVSEENFLNEEAILSQELEGFDAQILAWIQENKACLNSFNVSELTKLKAVKVIAEDLFMRTTVDIDSSKEKAPKILIYATNIYEKCLYDQRGSGEEFFITLVQRLWDLSKNQPDDIDKWLDTEACIKLFKRHYLGKDFIEGTLKQFVEFDKCDQCDFLHNKAEFPYYFEGDAQEIVVKWMLNKNWRQKGTIILDAYGISEQSPYREELLQVIGSFNRDVYEKWLRFAKDEGSQYHWIEPEVKIKVFAFMLEKNDQKTEHQLYTIFNDKNEYPYFHKAHGIRSQLDIIGAFGEAVYSDPVQIAKKIEKLFAQGYINSHEKNLQAIVLELDSLKEELEFESILNAVRLLWNSKMNSGIDKLVGLLRRVPSEFQVRVAEIIVDNFGVFTSVEDLMYAFKGIDFSSKEKIQNFQDLVEKSNVKEIHLQTDKIAFFNAINQVFYQDNLQEIVSKSDSLKERTGVSELQQMLSAVRLLWNPDMKSGIDELVGFLRGVPPEFQVRVAETIAGNFGTFSSVDDMRRAFEHVNLSYGIAVGHFEKLVVASKIDEIPFQNEKIEFFNVLTQTFHRRKVGLNFQVRVAEIIVDNFGVIITEKGMEHAFEYVDFSNEEGIQNFQDLVEQSGVKKIPLQENKIAFFNALKQAFHQDNLQEIVSKSDSLKERTGVSELQQMLSAVILLWNPDMKSGIDELVGFLRGVPPEFQVSVAEIIVDNFGAFSSVDDMKHAFECVDFSSKEKIRDFQDLVEQSGVKKIPLQTNKITFFNALTQKLGQETKQASKVQKLLTLNHSSALFKNSPSGFAAARKEAAQTAKRTWLLSWLEAHGYSHSEPLNLSMLESDEMNIFMSIREDELELVYHRGLEVYKLLRGLDKSRRQAIVNTADKIYPQVNLREHSIPYAQLVEKLCGIGSISEEEGVFLGRLSTIEKIACDLLDSKDNARKINTILEQLNQLNIEDLRNLHAKLQLCDSELPSTDEFSELRKKNIKNAMKDLAVKESKLPAKQRVYHILDGFYPSYFNFTTEDKLEVMQNLADAVCFNPYQVIKKTQELFGRFYMEPAKKDFQNVISALSCFETEQEFLAITKSISMLWKPTIEEGHQPKPEDITKLIDFLKKIPLISQVDVVSFIGRHFGSFSKIEDMNLAFQHTSVSSQQDINNFRQCVNLSEVKKIPLQINKVRFFHALTRILSKSKPILNKLIEAPFARNNAYCEAKKEAKNKWLQSIIDNESCKNKGLKEKIKHFKNIIFEWENLSIFMTEEKLLEEICNHEDSLLLKAQQEETARRIAREESNRLLLSVTPPKEGKGNGKGCSAPTVTSKTGTPGVFSSVLPHWRSRQYPSMYPEI